MKKATDIRDNIFAIDKQLHALSNDVAQSIELDGIDFGYLESKMNQLCNTAKHIKGQLKYLKKGK